MTYRELLAWLQTLSASELNYSVTVFDSNNDEYRPATGVDLSVESDVIDDGHPVIVL